MHVAGTPHVSKWPVEPWSFVITYRTAPHTAKATGACVASSAQRMASVSVMSLQMKHRARIEDIVGEIVNLSETSDISSVLKSILRQE